MKSLWRDIFRSRSVFVLVFLLAGMATLMIGAMKKESATVDETTYLGGGYSYFKTGSYRLSEGHPILSQIITSLPLLFFNLQISPSATAVLQAKAFLPYTPVWRGPVGSTRDLFPDGLPNYYHWALPETQLFGQMFVYDSANDAENMLFWGRMVQVGLAVLTGLLVFVWARQLGGDRAGLLAVLLWGAHPIALAYGHLILTDMSMTLMLLVTLWVAGWFLQNPTLRSAVTLGAVFGLSLTMKFTALGMVPIIGVAAMVFLWKSKPLLQAEAIAHWRRQVLRSLFPMAMAAWVVVMLVYLPNWSAPPPIEPQHADRLGVPTLFQVLRPFLIPKDFFKGIVLYAGLGTQGYESYLMGHWSATGWWYYFPLALMLKSPIPYLLLSGLGVGLLIVRFQRLKFAQLLPWIGAVLFLGFAMTGKVNIGVRHVMPILPLLAVGVSVQLVSPNRKLQIVAWVLSAWLAVVPVFAYPYYIQYFNELAGGIQNGYQYLIDSNFDWGQDAIRLKNYLEDRGIKHIYLDFFGTQLAIGYHKIPNTRVNAQTAQQIRDGVLVVSVSQLMRPEWGWLRESRQPVARIAHTLFVYQFP